MKTSHGSEMNIVIRTLMHRHTSRFDVIRINIWQKIQKLILIVILFFFVPLKRKTNLKNKIELGDSHFPKSYVSIQSNSISNFVILPLTYAFK